MNRIVYELRRRGETQRALAGRLGVSEALVSGWVTGRKGVPAGCLAEMAEHFGCSVSWLLGLSDDRSICRNRIRDELARHGESAADMAAAVGVSAATAAAWADGSKAVPAAAVVSLRDHFGVTADWLLGLSRVRNEVGAA